MKLKLAEYKDGKFERFLKIGKDFLFGGEFVYLPKGIPQPDFWENGEQEEFYGSLFKLDQKDPLNRFNGLFDGRTYGEGGFVLIENNQDDIYKCQIASDEEIRASYRRDGFYTWENRILIGNLHENLELWEKVK
jgi:hypothetical protein